MNIGSIGNSPYSFYNSASRVNSEKVNSLAAENKVRESESREINKSEESPLSSATYQREDYKGPQKTELSTDNLYQKRMVSDPHFAMERLAGKLFDKLPQIFSDIKSLSADAMDNASSSKVVITENGADYLERQAQNAALQDISLS